VAKRMDILPSKQWQPLDQWGNNMTFLAHHEWLLIWAALKKSGSKADDPKDLVSLKMTSKFLEWHGLAGVCFQSWFISIKLWINPIIVPIFRPAACQGILQLRASHILPRLVLSQGCQWLPDFHSKRMPDE